mmetsp:Transcript_26286/g.57023  ORF Transcript_26286/g.57023 Transcript_26286/m.57023 type:complete len:313 (-) Transcript_26286:116-1054(-)|eukprot:CAMPEP_0206444840 /NCGR_PEP_ID=MMETSP0324_2-20121206/15143_1 /ASSEMBLY_ACC=CAM_ASM_000836 /TAXON_ID=2866 /ORGANISM="Crypthecodinium cohnii, Strain Seligo" /LENGTH=312 /DNA_ID=CAMNT_0053912923 /DNA_START=273 /DNA_END=1211 /DNA_ORIENTATION=+
MCILCVAAAAATADPSSSASTNASQRHDTDFIVAKFVSPVLFSIGPISIYSYGLLVAAALGFATLAFDIELTRGNVPLDVINGFFVFLFGFAVGSKAHLALSAVGAGEPLTWEAFDIRTGHSFMGSQVGAVLCMLLYVKWKKIGVFSVLDALLPCCLLGHTIGKIGCFVSGDGCYGPYADPQKIPWAMSFPNGMMPIDEPVHPTPLYEAVLSFTVFWVSRTWIPLPQPEAAAGRRTALVLVLYGIERCLIEPFRRHPPVEFFGGLTEYQALAVVLFLIGLTIEVVVRKRLATVKKSGKKSGGVPSKNKAKAS